MGQLSCVIGNCDSVNLESLLFGGGFLKEK